MRMMRCTESANLGEYRELMIGVGDLVKQKFD